ncbi:hypothetical protein FJZ31_24610 [Candidatus Poribacteria bacterium]|nr:hypothetical protein [Candidatus Poribacteria bacterium]
MRDLVKMNLHLDVGENADEEELDRLTRQLRDEMRELEVEAVELVSEKTTPEGAMGDAVTLGALAVVVLPVVIPKLIDFLQAWLMRGENRTVKIKTQVGDRSLEVEYSPKTMSPSKLKKLVDMLTGALTG